jgi:hypothetical protein
MGVKRGQASRRQGRHCDGFFFSTLRVSTGVAHTMQASVALVFWLAHLYTTHYMYSNDYIPNNDVISQQGTVWDILYL